MDLSLQLSVVRNTQLIIPGSKSETNRLLLLQALYPEIQLENTSDSDDSEVMRNALSGNETTIDIHHAGTAMRFLTAYFAMQENRDVILTGSPRMKERPIAILVDALRQLGAEIEYVEKEGFPPLKITGRQLTKSMVALKADVSSQYISALLLVGSKLQNGLKLVLEGHVTSLPYIQMTLGLLREMGVETTFAGNVILIEPGHRLPKPKTFQIESDWSSASYFYSIVALSNHGAQLTLSNYRENSLQGDRSLAAMYQNFGVETAFIGNQIVLKKSGANRSPIQLNLNETPDLAQTIAVTCFALGLECQLTGLQTLKIKETDRLEALQTELAKLGAIVSVTNDSLTLGISETINPNIRIATYNDHRMAMAFAPLALKVPIVIENAQVVSKSYPAFWHDLEQIGFKMAT